MRQLLTIFYVLNLQQMLYETQMRLLVMDSWYPWL